MDDPFHPSGLALFNHQLHAWCRGLIKLALGLWRLTEIKSSDDFFKMMRALVNIDEMLKYACSPGTIDVANLKNWMSLLELQLDGVSILTYPTPNELRAILDRIGEVEMTGLGQKTIPASLVPLGDAGNLMLYLHPGRRLSHWKSMPEGAKATVILDAYRDQLSMQVGVLNCPIRQTNDFAKDLESFFQTLGLERPTHLLSYDHGLIGINPRVHIIMSFQQSSELYSLMKHPHEPDIIFQDRYGDLYSSRDVWKSYDFPRHLSWTLYRLKMNKEEELDTLALVPVESPLTRELGAQNTPVEHFQTLLSTWQRIIELGKHPAEELGIGWLIEVDDLWVDSPEAHRYLSSANQHGLAALSKWLECALYPNDTELSPFSHSVLGKIHHGVLGDAAANEITNCIQSHFIKSIRSLRIDYGHMKPPEGLNDNPATRLLRRWRRYNHPNVLSLVGIREMPCNGIGLVLSPTNTKNLSEYLDATPEVDRCELCIQISSGLAYLHGAGVVHGSLQAANILVSLGGEAIVSDPIILGHVGENTHGRAGWLAPEVIKGEASTAASDIYSLGMTILEVISGTPSDLEKKPTKASDVELSDLGSFLPERPEKSIPTNSKDGGNLWRLLSQCCNAEPSNRPIAEFVAETMKTITPDGLQPLYARQESENAPCFESTAFQEESFELSDIESVSSTLSGPAISEPNADDQGLFGPESRTMAQKVLKQLAAHGCENLTDHIDWNSFSAFPFCTGGFGDVYRGMLLSGLQVAVKTPRVSLNILEDSPDYLKNVAREIHTWNKYDHPNVLHFLGLAEFRGQIGMVAPWMENGRSLSYLEKAFSTDRCKLCTQICEGVAYLHRIEIVHGDIKGDNVLISGDGVAVVSDFGGSLLKNRSLNIIPLEKGTCLTYRWAAPELLLQGGMNEMDEPNDTIETRASQTSVGGGSNTRESDIYALGMTILEIISSKVPWYWIKSEPAIIMRVCSPGKPHKRPRQEIPMHSLDGDKLWKLLNSCWSYKPGLRPTAIKVGDVMRTITPGTLKAYPPPAISNRCALFV